MPSEHAKIGPSSFARVKACPASLRFAAQFPNESNPAAEEGTACHEAVERMLDGEHIEPGFVAENGITLTAEHIANVQEVVDWVIEQEFDRLYLEVRLPIGEALGLNDPDIMWGTSDIVGIKGSDITIADAKFGFVPVDPKNNAQAMCYLIGAIHAIGHHIPGDIDNIYNVILQPRAGGVKQARVTFEDIAKFRKEAIEAVNLALSPDAPFNPGPSQCRFCPGSGSCRAQITEEFEVIDTIEDPDALTPEELARWLGEADHIIATVKAMQVTAMKRMEAGQTIPGWKRVAGQSRARWVDEEEVIEELERQNLDLDIYAPRKPATQTLIRKVLGNEVMNTLTTRPPGQPKLARVEDKGDPLDSDFEVLD